MYIATPQLQFHILLVILFPQGQSRAVVAEIDRVFIAMSVRYFPDIQLYLIHFVKGIIRTYLVINNNIFKFCY
mgnify:CR=1 FL=1